MKILQSTPYNSMGDALFEYRHASGHGRKRQIKSRLLPDQVNDKDIRFQSN